MKKFVISSENIDIRLDKWLKKNFSLLTQSFLEKNLRKGNIKVNNSKQLSKYKLKLDDLVTIYNYSSEVYGSQSKKTSSKIIPSKYKSLFNSSIIFENENFIILNKWTGISTQGGSKINISIDHIIKNISHEYNLVHRLDRETSGLLIIAKNLRFTKFIGNLLTILLIDDSPYKNG